MPGIKYLGFPQSETWGSQEEDYFLKFISITDGGDFFFGGRTVGGGYLRTDGKRAIPQMMLTATQSTAA